MKKQLLIRNIIAVFLLLLFAFGSTPKQFLHNLVANHKDDTRSSKTTPGTSVAKTPRYCHCDNLVVESPFVADAPQAAMHLPAEYTIFQYHPAETFSLPHYSCYALRGPPSLS